VGFGARDEYGEYGGEGGSCEEEEWWWREEEGEVMGDAVICMLSMD
jgi:hypothetical protein